MENTTETPTEKLVVNSPFSAVMPEILSNNLLNWMNSQPYTVVKQIYEIEDLAIRERAILLYLAEQKIKDCVQLFLDYNSYYVAKYNPRVEAQQS